MWDWLSENAGIIQVAVAAITALVWLVYLHILVSGLRRQRRTDPDPSGRRRGHRCPRHRQQSGV